MNETMTQETTVTAPQPLASYFSKPLSPEETASLLADAELNSFICAWVTEHIFGLPNGLFHRHFAQLLQDARRQVDCEFAIKIAQLVSAQAPKIPRGKIIQTLKVVGIRDGEPAE